MKDFCTEELLIGLRALADDVDNHLDSLRRKMAIIASDRANIAAMLQFQEEALLGSEWLPHVSVRRILKPSELRSLCFQALEKAGGALDTRDLARHCMARKGMDSEDILVRQKVVYSVVSAMKTARRHGRVVTCGKRKGVLMWRLCAKPDAALTRERR